MLNGICPLCHLSNSCADDHNSNSFDCPPDSYHPPHPTYETYSGDFCGNDSQSGYDCPPQFPLNYEPERGYTQNYNSCPHDSPSFPQQSKRNGPVFGAVAGENSFDCPPESYHPSQPTYETYSGDTCGNDSHFGYDCPPQFPLNYEPEPGYIQNYNSYPHDSLSFPQQYPCCEDCGVTHEPYQCQPKNHDYYHEKNSCYDSNSISFDQSQPQQYTVNHPIFNAYHDLLGSQKQLNITLTVHVRNGLSNYSKESRKEAT
nr:hypothetical protein [Tanacetum cinerariifolium]